MRDVMASIEQRITAIESTLCRSLVDVIAEQLAWSKGRDNANSDDLTNAVRMLREWNDKRDVPLCEFYEPVPSGLVIVEGDSEC